MSEMIAVFSSSGVAGLLVAICVLLTFNLIAKIGGMAWDFWRSKDKVSEDTMKGLTTAVTVNTAATGKNTEQIAHLEKALAEIPKLKLDLRRAFAAVKIVAGDRWPEVRKEIMDEIDQ